MNLVGQSPKILGVKSQDALVVFFLLNNSRQRSKISFDMLVRRLLLTNTIDLLRKHFTVVGVPLLSQYWVDMAETCDILRTLQINELTVRNG